jgi:hypothetical protein
MKLKNIFLFIVFSITLLASNANAKSITISKENFGNSWPFTVSQGELSCSGNSVTFKANGKTYAVNGTAKSRGYAPINEIWKDDEKMIKILKESFPGEDIGPPPKINIGPIIDKGLSLCK